MELQPLGPIVPMILQIPTFIVNLRRLLFEETSNPSVKDKGTKLLNDISSCISQYAELHFALKDWKMIHEIVQDTMIQFSNEDEFISLLEPSSSQIQMNWDNIKTKWDNYRRIWLARFYDRYRDIRYVNSFKVELRFEGYSLNQIQSEELIEGVKKFEGLITDNVTRQRYDDSTIYFRQFRSFLEDALVAADGEIRRMAGALAELSIKLSTELRVRLEQ